MEVEIVHESIDYDLMFNNLAKNLVDEALPIVQVEVMKVLRSHRITGETEESIKVLPVSQSPQRGRGISGFVFTRILHAAVLEFMHVPFMRLGAKRARKHLRPLVKKVFGETMRGAIRTKRKRR